MIHTKRDIIKTFAVNLDHEQFSLIESIDTEIKPISDIIYEILENLRKHGESKIIFTPEEETKYQKLFSHRKNELHPTDTTTSFALTDERIVTLSYTDDTNLSLNTIVEDILKTLVSKRINNPDVAITINKRVQQQWQYQKELSDGLLHTNQLIKNLEKTIKQNTHN